MRVRTCFCDIRLLSLGFSLPALPVCICALTLPSPLPPPPPQRNVCVHARVCVYVTLPDPASTPAASANDLDAVDFEMAPIPAEVKDKHLRIISLAASGKLDEALPQLVALTQEHPTFAGAFNDLFVTFLCPSPPFSRHHFSL